MSEDNSNPIDPLQITDADIARHVQHEGWIDRKSGVPEDLANLRDLQSEIDALQAKVDAQSANGGCVDPVLQRRLDARQNTLAWQKAAYSVDPERRDRLAADADNNALLKSARDTDMQSAVNREIAEQRRQGFTLSPMEAMQVVERRIATEGEDRVLPQYARIKNRLTADAPSTPATATPVSQPTIVDGHDLDKMEQTIRAAEAAGEDASDSKALLKYLRSKAAA
ncbi:MAG: hypothetical protein QNJ14_00945 [Woeseiaceae bacterium]|nr:hypothetical protein [Woeseiaceae bacterium]